MAIVGLPGWVGQSAVDETGQRWMDAAMRDVRVAVPGWMGSMANQSKEIYLSIGANHNYDRNTLINWMRAQGGAPVVITITGDLVSNSRGNPCLEFPSNLPNAYIQLIINSGVTVYGRGGRGGWTHSDGNGNGEAGGIAIQNNAGTKLRIRNNGAIAGGGGGGGGIAYRPHSGANWQDIGAGGGRPFGAAGGGGYSGGAASLTGAGGGYNYGNAHSGAGGNVGAKGQNAWNDGGKVLKVGAGGNAGAAVAGNAPNWQNVGTIYGSRV